MRTGRLMKKTVKVYRDTAFFSLTPLFLGLPTNNEQSLPLRPNQNIMPLPIQSKKPSGPNYSYLLLLFCLLTLFQSYATTKAPALSLTQTPSLLEPNTSMYDIILYVNTSPMVLSLPHGFQLLK